jgi:hypothetical protein
VKLSSSTLEIAMKSLKKLLVSALLVGISGTLLAQPGAGDDPPTSLVTGTKAVTLTPEEMVERAAQLGAQSKENLRTIVELQLIARREKDVIKLNCINDKLLQAKALQNLLELADEDLQSSLGARDNDAVHHHYTRVTISAENIKTLRQEAGGCAGETSSYTGGTIVEVTGPDIPDDPTSDPFGADGIEPPAYASPFN